MHVWSPRTAFRSLWTTKIKTGTTEATPVHKMQFNFLVCEGVLSEVLEVLAGCGQSILCPLWWSVGERTLVLKGDYLFFPPRDLADHFSGSCRPSMDHRLGNTALETPGFLVPDTLLNMLLQHSRMTTREGEPTSNTPHLPCNGKERRQL